MDAHKVLWHEGMFLTPQHFQQADRWTEAQIGQVARTLRPLAWGIATLTIDRRALAGGDLALLACEAILPDGLALSALDPDQLPPSRPLAAKLEGRRDRIGVLLAAPARRPGGVAVSDEGEHDGRPTRYRRRFAELADDNAGAAARRLALAVPNLRILFDDEPHDGLVCLRIAEVVRAPDGGFALAEDHVPPCLQLGAAPALLGCVRRIGEILVGRATELAQQRRSRTQGLVEFSVSEIAAYLMLLTVNGAIPGVLEALARPQTHPADVYARLAALAGQLCTFADDGHAKDVPPYRHEEPMASFRALETRLRALLTTAMPTRYVPIPLERQSDRVQAGPIPEAVVDGARYFLAVHSALPAERVLREIPHKAKVGSGGRIGTLIAQAMPGIRLAYLAVPPAEIPTQPGGTYFELDQASPEWAQAAKTRSLAIYLPPEFAEARSEFLAVKS